MALQFRTLELRDLDEILEFEKTKLRDTVESEMEREFATWSARWRREALEHYLPLGWSFVARDPERPSKFDEKGEMAGYFMAQPLLFFDNQTQSLWVEHLQYSTLSARDELCDLAYRLSREKHFQRVYFPIANGISNAINHLKPEVFSQASIFIKTTRTN